MTERNEVLEFLDELLSTDEEIQREAGKEQVRLNLALAMVRARKARGLSQAEVAKRLGVTQSWVSKLENPDIAHTFEAIVEYLQAINADLDMVIRTGSKEFIVSRAEPATTAATATNELGDLLLESSWEGPKGDPSSTLVWFLSLKSGLRHPYKARLTGRRQVRYAEESIPAVVASDATTSGRGGSNAIVN